MTGTSRNNLIALVDDESSVLSAVSRLLRSHNFECLGYASAEDALADPEIFRAQCHILDIQLRVWMDLTCATRLKLQVGTFLVS